VPKDAARDLAIIELAERQGMVVSWQQLRSIGVSWSGVQSRTRRGMLRRATRGVYEVQPSQDDLIRRERAIVYAMGAGCVLSGASAARLWGLELPVPNVIEVTIPWTRDARRSPDRGVVIDRTRHLPSRDRDRRSELPVTSCARTFLDLAPRFDYEELRKAVDNAICRRILHPQALAALLGDPRNRGKPGSGTLRRILVPWLQPVKPESVPEVDVLRFMLEAGIPAPVLQRKVFDGAGNLIARLDFAWPDEKVAVEMDGFRYHSSPDAHAHDRERDIVLGELGWIVIRITPTGLAKSGPAFLNNLRDRLAERRARM
jgi:hypothetical protein